MRLRHDGDADRGIHDQQTAGKVSKGGDGPGITIDQVYEIAVGYLRREPSTALHITWRDLDILIRAQRDRDQDAWDYTRHIMAAMGAGGGRPRDVIHLDRDKPEIDDEMIENARKFLQRMNN